MNHRTPRRKAAHLPEHLLGVLRQWVGEEGADVVAAKLAVDARSVRRYVQPSGPRAINFALRERVVEQLERRVHPGSEQTNDDRSGVPRPEPTATVTIEALALRYQAGTPALWDLPAQLFGDRVRAAAGLKTELAGVRRHLGNYSDVGEGHRLAVARLAVTFTDLSFAAATLEAGRSDAIALGVSILAPLLYSRNEDVSREARLLTAQLLRAEEGELWSFVTRPTATADETRHVLNVYDESSYHLRRAGGDVGPNSAVDDRQRFAVNEVCRARTLLQQGKVKEAEAALGNAPAVLGRSTSTVHIYRSHLRMAEGRVDDAVVELETARLLFVRRGTEVGSEGAAACVARLYEITGSDEYATAAARALDRWGLRWKYADTACFECVERRLSRKLGKRGGAPAAARD